VAQSGAPGAINDIDFLVVDLVPLKPSSADERADRYRIATPT
jgi:hypothetical protein